MARTAENTENKGKERGERGERAPREGQGRGRDREHGGEREEQNELVDRLVNVNRVAKVIKGGRRFAFAALVVVGDQKGRVGYGSGKAREVPEAIRKATERAKRDMIRVPLRDGRTIHHDVEGRYGAGKVVMRAAPAGTGIIAGGAMRAVFETVGIQDVVAKTVGLSNPYNMVKATFEAFREIYSPKAIAGKRGKKVADIITRRDGAKAAEAAEAASETAEVKE